MGNIKKKLVSFLCAIATVVSMAFSMSPTVVYAATNIAGGYEFLATRELYCIKGTGTYRVTPLTEKDKNYNLSDPYSDCGLYQDTGCLGAEYYKDMYAYFNTTGNYIELIFPYGQTAWYQVYWRACKGGSTTTSIPVPFNLSTDYFVYDNITYGFARIASPTGVANSWAEAGLLSDIPKYASREAAMGTVKQINASGTGATVKVVTKVAAGYTVNMPAIFSLDYDETTNRFQYEYTLGVKGCLGANEVLNISPAETFTMKTAAGTTLTGNTIQTVKTFVSDNPSENEAVIKYGTFTYITGIVYLPTVYSGDWNGNLVFTFSKVAR